MSIESVLARLDKVKQINKNQWASICPVHNSNSRKLYLKEGSDGRVLAYCQVCGCNAIEVADQLGLDRSEVFAPDNDYKAPVISKRMEEEEKMDRLVLAMADVTPPVTLADKRRVQLAQARLEGIQGKRDKLAQHNETKSVDVDMPF